MHPSAYFHNTRLCFKDLIRESYPIRVILKDGICDVQGVWVEFGPWNEVVVRFVYKSSNTGSAEVCHDP